MAEISSEVESAECAEQIAAIIAAHEYPGEVPSQSERQAEDAAREERNAKSAQKRAAAQKNRADTIAKIEQQVEETGPSDPTPSE